MNRFSRPTTCRRFALRPLPLALAIALTTSVLSARAGDSFTNVQQVVGATITNPNANTTNVNQSAHNAYIQAGGFNIAAQDAVKVFQPSNTANLLIQVTGYDPTAILGQLQANGRVFLSNPNGVLFGAGARIDVGSLVATNLSMDADEFMRSRVRLFDRGNSRGSVVNAGSIKADGTVALVGTEVSNLGSIVASRVGLAALSDVVVDVEGDGLIFFQMSGNRASAKLQQLGSITADGGLVELRAEARGAVADTVLNMDGIIQARSIGSRNGQVIIDGGSGGVTKVTGTIDVQGTGAGETGGRVQVLGDRVALGSTALIDASGDAGGGTVLVGGDYQGGGDVRRASHTRVADGATIKANATGNGDGGKVVVWADGSTAYQGLIEARGGAFGGNGGMVEVSGKQDLAFWGTVDTYAAHGALGTLLLDPNNIFVISDAASPTGTLTTDFSDLDNSPAPTAGNFSVRASAINASVADITLVATSDITINSAIDRTVTPGAAGKSLTLLAGSDINVNASIKTNDGNLTMTATTGSIKLGADLDAGTASVTLNSPVVLNASVTISGDTLVHLLGAVESNSITGPFNLTVDAGTGMAQFDGALGGSSGKRALNSLTVTGTSLIGTASVTTTGDQTYHGAVVVKTNTALTSTAGSVILDSTLNSQDSTARNVTLSATTGGESVILGGTVGNTFKLGTLTTSGATAINTASIDTTGNQTYNNAVTVGADTTLTSTAGDITFSSTLNSDSTARAVTLSATATGHKVTLANTVGAGAALQSLTISGPTLINTTTITTVGDQTYNGAIKFGAHTTFTSQTGSLDFNSTLDSDALGTLRSITLNATTAGQGSTIGDVAGGTIALNSLTVNGAAFINTSAITTNGDQLYNGAVTVGANTTIKANAGSVAFGSTLDADSTARNVTLSAATTGEAVTLGGAVGATNTLGTFVVDGVAEINGGDATTAAVTANTHQYKNDVKLGGAGTTKTLVGNTLTFTNNTDIIATGYNLVLQTNALALNGATSVGGNALTLIQRTASGSIGLDTTATEDLNLSTAQLTALGSFSSLTIGKAGTTSTVEFGGAYTLTRDTTLVGDTSVTLLGITGAGHDLDLTSASSVFNGAVTGASEVTTSGATTVNADIGATTLIDFGGTTTLSTGGAGTTRTLDAASVKLVGLATGNKNITIKADALDLSGTFTSSGSTATLATRTNGKAIALQTGTASPSDLEIGPTTLALFSQFAQLNIGRGDSNSAISATSAITLPTATTLISGTGTISLAAVTGGGFGLTLTGSGDTTLSGAFTNVGSLVANGGGKTVITTSLTTTTAMNFASGEDVEFGGGGSAITLRSGALTFSGDLDVDNKNTTLTADSLSLSGDILNATGATATITSNTRTVIRVNATSADSALDINSALLGEFGGFSQLTVGSTGASTSILTGAITLPAHTTFASGGGDVTLGAITGGGFDLTTNTTGGTVTFKGDVANVRDLLTNGTPAAIVIDTASIATTRKQVYNANVTLGTGTASRTLSAPTLELAAGRTITAGAHDLTLQADTLTLGVGASVGGSAGSDLTLATFTGSKSIGLQDNGTSDVQFTTALLSQFSGFDTTTIRAGLTSAATGTITVGDGGGSALTLPANLRLVSGTGDISILNPIDNSVGSLGITSTGGDVLIAQDIGASGSNLTSLTVTTGGDIKLQGISVFANSATFDGDVVLGTNATSSSDTTTLNGGTYTLTGDIRGTGQGVQSLYSYATLTKLQGNVGVASATRLLQLYVRDAEVGGQLFATDYVALYGSTTLTADTHIEAATTYLGGFTSTNTFGAATFDLAIKTDALNVALAGVTGGDQWSLAPLTSGNAIRISTSGGGAGILLVDPTLLTQWGSFGHLTIGSATTGNITVDHTAAITLGADLTLLSGTGDVMISSALQGAQSLTIDTDGLTHVQADLGSSGNVLSALTITGRAEFAGNGAAVAVRTSGDQDYQDDVTVANATTLRTTAGSVRLRDTLNAKTGASATADLTIDTTGGSARFDGTVGATTALHSLTTNAALINGASVTTVAGQTYHGNVTLSSASTTLKGGTVTIDGNVAGTTTGAQALVLDATDAVLKGTVGTTGLRLASLQVNGTSTLSGGNVFTTGAQTYTGALTLGANTALTSTSGNVQFGGTIDSDSVSARTLAVNSGANTRFAGAVGGTRALSSLTTDAAGTTELAAAVTTSGTQTYNDQVDINGSVTLNAGGNVAFKNTVDGKTAGTGALVVNSAGQTSFEGAVGATRALASLATDAAGTTRLQADITTTGAVNFQDAVTLASDLTIEHGGLLTFGSTLDGAQDLTLDGGAGNAAVNFTGAVGATTALSSLTVEGTGNANFLAGSSGATTTGTQRYEGSVVLTGSNKVFVANNLDIDGSFGGANGLTLSTNGLTLDGALTGTGALVIQTLTAGTTIGVGNGATGTLNIAQNVLNGTGGFSSLLIGRADGTGAVDVGTASFGANTTLRSGSGNIALNGAVNSLSGTPVDLRVETGGAIVLAGNMGATHALREISTSHVVATPNAISIAAARVTLQSSTNFTLNNLTLTGGGISLVQSAQHLVLAGDINLSGGGTLGLVSSLSPSKLGVTDTEYAGNDNLTVGLIAGLKEASAGVEQTGGKIITAAGTTLYVRTTQGASINLMQADNDIQGGISAVSGRIGEAANTTRLTSPDGGGDITVGFVRVASKQINVLGQAANDADQTLVAAGIEGDAVVLSADRINTSANNGLIRARLPYDNNQGTLTAIPGLTLLLSSTGLNGSQAYGGVVESDRIQVSVGNSTGGYITVRPKGGASLGPGFVSLGGNTTLRPFYDGSGKVTEVPVFYNGDVPQTPQEVGALSAVTAVIEEARRQRFEEAVRTENVSARLRSGVIAEVGAGRPATEGSDSIRMPASCTPAPDSLSCQ